MADIRSTTIGCTLGGHEQTVRRQHSGSVRMAVAPSCRLMTPPPCKVDTQKFLRYGKPSEISREGAFQQRFSKRSCTARYRHVKPTLRSVPTGILPFKHAVGYRSDTSACRVLAMDLLRSRHRGDIPQLLVRVARCRLSASADPSYC